VLPIILTVIVAVGVGVASERRAGPLAHRARGVVLRAMLWVLVPFVVYVSIARLDLSLDAGLSIAIAAAVIFSCGGLTWRLARGPLQLARASTGSAIICTIQANTGYLGLPLCAALFTHAELLQAVAYDALITLPTFLFASYAIGALFGDAADLRAHERLRAVLLRNPLLAAVAAGLLVPRAWAPDALVTPSRVAIFALLPLGFYVVGVTLADEADEGMLRIPPPLTPPVAAVAALRMMLPPLALLAASALIEVPDPFFLLAAMPVGINTVLVAHSTGLDLRLAATSIAWTTTVALAAIAALAAVGVL
jgi:predicted permease